MPTHLHALVSTTHKRWEEVDTLLALTDHTAIGAIGAAGKTEAVAKAARRAVIVLTVAHLEGLLKDAVKAIIADMNSHSAFRLLPAATKRMFVRQFTGTGLNGGAGSQEANNREVALVRLLETHDAKIDSSMFTQGTANPTPDVITRLCADLGSKNPFLLFYNSRLDDVFAGNASDAHILLSELEDHLLHGLARYQYTTSPALFGIAGPTKQKPKETLWEVFLNHLLFLRHQIAHGASLDDSQSSAELSLTVCKSKILAYATILVMATP